VAKKKASKVPSATESKRRNLSLDDYENGVIGGDRSVLARAITLIESTNGVHQSMAQELLVRLLPKSGAAYRIGVTGVPGVGKSTFIDTFGSNLTNAGHKVAVLAVDPTSSLSGGSILGDKTRMSKLSVDQNAYIRPSPTSGVLGGVTRTTRETMILCEAGGFDVIVVETVGVGQSETLVADMVDFFLALMLPGAGDELQGIKKGILELADIIAINKADGENRNRANVAKGHYLAALHILTPSSPNWAAPVLTCSGLENEGLVEIWRAVLDHRRAFADSGEFEERRQAQSVRWMWSMLEDQLFANLKRNAGVKKILPTLERQVALGQITPVLAVEKLMKKFAADA
jgi:LAO/AO transport system kinase